MSTPLATGSTRHPPARIVSFLTMAAIGLIAMAVLLVLRAERPGPSLETIRALAAAREFRRAQDLLETYLRRHGDDSGAHYLMAQLATEPPDPSPEVALAHLRAARPRDDQERARLRFFEGKARYQQGRYDLAESAWKESLRLDPLVPESGWALVDLLDKESRVPEAHAIGMKLVDAEPEPRDRVHLLLEMARMDIDVVSPSSQAILFGSLAREHPEDLPLNLTVGLALVADSRGESGLEVLEAALRRYPDAPEAWEGWLTGLYRASQFGRFAEEFGRLPRRLADDPRFAQHEGMVAQNARDWQRAVRAFRRATEHEPYNGIHWYRLRAALRQVNARAELERVDRWYTSFEEAFKLIRPAYYEALAVPDLAVSPHPELYHRLADLRERMGRPDEARAWHRQVLRDDPADAISVATLKRLGSGPP
jgi:tetratricopeptide (TPR) repeat protein